MRFLSFAIILISFSLIAAQKSEKPIETTICEIIENPETFDGKFVRLRANVLSGFEVFAIADPALDCESISLSYPGGGPAASTTFGLATPRINRPRVTLRSDREFKKLEKLRSAEMHPRSRGSICMDCKRYHVMATLVGRVDVASRGTGFGHLNAHRARFVLQSVVDVTAIDLASNYDPKEYSTKPIRFPTGYITGKVIGPDGQPIRGIEVNAVTTEDLPLYLSEFTEWTDERGMFKIDVPPGNYVVGVNLDSPASPEFPFPATFSPGKLEKTNAKRLTVLDRQTVIADIRLQGGLERRLIPVKVIWPNGSPVADANVWLAEQERPSQVVGNSVSHTNANGEFNLTGFQGRSYVLRADIYVKPGYIPHCANKRQIRSDEPIRERIVMTLTRTGNICRGDD